MSTHKDISPAELNKVREEGGTILLIDVRSPAEFAEAHACGAVNIPLDHFDPSKVLAVGGSPSNPVYLICRSGARSVRACSILSDAGFEYVYNVSSGTMGWLEAGLPSRVASEQRASC